METSENIKSIIKALIEFHRKEIRLNKNAKGNYSKYCTLDTIIDEIRKPLAECGLVIMPTPEGLNRMAFTLFHESGEWIRNEYEMTPDKLAPQGTGSRMTYQERYGIVAMLLLQIGEDDDGQKASPSNEPTVYNQPRQMKKITPEQLQSWKRGIMQGKSIIDALAKYEEMFIVEEKVIEELKQTSLEYEALSNEQTKKELIINNTQNNE